MSEVLSSSQRAALELLARVAEPATYLTEEHWASIRADLVTWVRAL